MTRMLTCTAFGQLYNTDTITDITARFMDSFGKQVSTGSLYTGGDCVLQVVSMGIWKWRVSTPTEFLQDLDIAIAEIMLMIADRPEWCYFFSCVK